MKLLKFEQINESKLNGKFKKWFGKSKVVDKRGKPLVVYHGTYLDIDKFEEKSFRYNGLYLTSKKKYAKNFGNNIISLFASLKNPYIINMENTNFSVKGGFIIGKRMFPSYRELSKDEISFLKSKGFDGIIVNVPSKIVKNNYGSEDIYEKFEIVVFNPNNVKSIENNGEWSLNNDNIYS